MTGYTDRDALRKLADAAARGPWEVDDGGGYDFSVTQGADGDYIASDVTPRDAAFIAAARTAVPALLAELEQADARLADALGYCRLVDGRPDLAAHPGFVAITDIRRALDAEL